MQSEFIFVGYSEMKIHRVKDFLINLHWSKKYIYLQVPDETNKVLFFSFYHLTSIFSTILIQSTTQISYTQILDIEKSFVVKYTGVYILKKLQSISNHYMWEI